MACLTKVPVSKPLTEVSSPESQIRRMSEVFLHAFASFASAFHAFYSPYICIYNKVEPNFT